LFNRFSRIYLTEATSAQRFRFASGVYSSDLNSVQLAFSFIRQTPFAFSCATSAAVAAPIRIDHGNSARQMPPDFRQTGAAIA
jgi:hypothetical protein